jgi:tetratricopeptide (TPR) repeat protein
VDDERERAVTLGDIARLQAQAHEEEDALALYHEELTIFQQLGDVCAQAVTLLDLGDLHLLTGRDFDAERMYQDSLAMFRQSCCEEGIYAAQARLGRLAMRQGQRAKAAQLLQEARQGLERLGFAPWVASLGQLMGQASPQAPS